ncbi:DEAD/DEAH box helicase [Sphingomonas sp. 3-13AW]|uniref:DEAD/DEAH box helicase n=1 Tax=Sphingomonas sp. 3-13AW TaxID=3050450 RepID=UPI003BB50CE9
MALQVRTREEIERAATALQDDLIARAVSSSREGRNSLIEAPTGAGKSRMYTRLANELAGSDKRVFVAAHRLALVTQGADNYDRWNDSRQGETTLGMKGDIDQSGRIVFSSIQTASSEKNLEKLAHYDILVIDEAHHATQDHIQYCALIDRMKKSNPNLIVVGATATPPELHKGLHPELAKADHHVATFEQAIEAGIVVVPETVRPHYLLNDERSTVADVVNRHRADPRSAEIEGGVTRDMRGLLPANWIELCADMYEKHLSGRQSLGFQERISEANELCEELRGRGIRASTVHSKIRDVEKVMRAYKHGEYEALLSVDMISEGWDVPKCRGILLTKYQTSEKELRQIYGRTSRGIERAHGETAPLLVDLGASTLMHGDLGAIARLQSLRGDIDRDVVPSDELLPGKSRRAFSPWVPMPARSPDAPQVFGTSIDGRLIYAAETAKGYVAVTTAHHEKRGDKVELLDIPGQVRKGIVSPDRLGHWMRAHIHTNERALAQMTSRSGQGVSRLEALLHADFNRNGASITNMVRMMTLPPIPKGQHIGMNAGCQR